MLKIIPFLIDASYLCTPRVTNFGDLNIHRRCFYLNEEGVAIELSNFSRESTELLQRNNYGDNPLHQAFRRYYDDKKKSQWSIQRKKKILAIIDQIYTVSLTSTVFEFFDILTMENNSHFNMLQSAIENEAPAVAIDRLLFLLSLSDQKLLITRKNKDRESALTMLVKKKDEAYQVKYTAKQKYLKKEKNFQNLMGLSISDPDFLDTLADNKVERDEAKRKSDDAEEVYSNKQAIYEYLLNILDAPDTDKAIASDPDTSFCSDFSDESEFSLLEDATSPATFSDGIYEESGYSSNEEIAFKKPRRV